MCQETKEQPSGKSHLNAKMNSSDMYFHIGYSKFHRPIDGFTNDVGWGCGIRAMQMMLARCMWKCDWNVQEFYQFFDFETIIHHSIPYGGIPGELFSLGTVTQAVCDIKSLFAIAQPPSVDLDDQYPKLVLLSTRLAPEFLEQTHLDVIKKFLKHPLNVGMLGGHNRSSYYFVALEQVMEDVVQYIDPHQMSSGGISPVGRPQKKMLIKNMDPCITFGWWCTNADELNTVKTDFADLLDTSCTFMSSALEMTDVDEDDIVLVG